MQPSSRGSMTIRFASSSSRIVLSESTTGRTIV
jgi:hypothetical protein